MGEKVCIMIIREITKTVGVGIMTESLVTIHFFPCNSVSLSLGTTVWRHPNIDFIGKKKLKI